MHVALEEGNEIWTGLADNEVVDVEKLRNPRQWRVPVIVRSVSPWSEGNL